MLTAVRHGVRRTRGRPVTGGEGDRPSRCGTRSCGEVPDVPRGAAKCHATSSSKAAAHSFVDAR